MWCQNTCSALFGFVTIHAYERQTDRWIELRLPRPCSHSCITR